MGQEGATVAMVVERYGEAEAFDRPFKDRCLSNWRAWRSILPEDWPYFGAIFEPVTAIAVQDTIEAMMSSVFGKENYFDVEPLDGQDDLSTELMRVHILNELRRMRYKGVKYLQTMEAVLYGNGIVHHSAVPVREADGQVTLHARERVVSRLNFFPGPGGKTIDEMPYALELRMVPLATAQRWVKDPVSREKLTKGAFSYSPWDNRFYAGNTADQLYDLWSRLATAGYDVATTAGPSGDKVPKFVEVLIYAEKPEVEDGCSRQIMVANRDVLIVDRPNPFEHGRKFWSSIGFSAIDSELWQEAGLPDLIAVLQDKINVRSNQINDLIELARNPMKYVGIGAGQPDSTLFEEYPGLVLQVQDPNAVRRIDRDQLGVGGDIFRDLDYSQAQVQRLSRVSDVGRGMVGSMSGLGKGTDTASGLAMMMQQQTRSMSFKLLLMEENGGTDALEMTASVAVQALTQPRLLRVGDNETLRAVAAGNGYVVLHPEELAGRWQFKSVGSSRSMDNKTKAQMLQGWLQMAVQVPEIQQDPRRVKALEAWKDIGEMMDVPHPSKYIRSDEELAEMTPVGSGMAAVPGVAMAGVAGGMPARGAVPGMLPGGGELEQPSTEAMMAAGGGE